MRYGVVAFIAVAFSTNAVAETMEQCMKRKVSELLDRKTDTVFKDYGCTTRGTEFVVQLDYQGFKVYDCSEPVCWTAPSRRRVLDAKATSNSAAGSDHGYTGPTYVPTPERASAVCFHVHARGPDKDIGARGWQKLNVTVTHEREFTIEEMTGFAVGCSREGAK